MLQIVPFILFAEVARLFLRGAGVGEFIAVGVAALLVMALSAAGTMVLLFGMHLYDARFAAALRRRLMDKLSTLPLGWFTCDVPRAVVKPLLRAVATCASPLHDGLDGQPHLLQYAERCIQKGIWDIV